MDQVVWVSGRTRRFGIVDDPIMQVRPLQFVSAEFAKRGPAAILIPIPGANSVHALPSTLGRVDPRLVVQTGVPMLDGAYMLPDASLIGMLRHTSKPAPVAGLVPPGPVAFDAIVKAAQTRLQAHRLPVRRRSAVASPCAAAR